MIDPRRTTKFGINPNIPHSYKRPRCTIEGCKKPKAIVSTTKDGFPVYRHVCQKHHTEHLAEKNGITYTQLRNKWHRYLKYRKDYCENIDGRLGKACTADIWWEGMLDVDHIDGNPNNNDPSNLQTLCKNCHAVKSNIFGDYKTPGRKKLKEL